MPPQSNSLSEELDTEPVRPAKGGSLAGLIRSEALRGVRLWLRRYPRLRHPLYRIMQRLGLTDRVERSAVSYTQWIRDNDTLNEADRAAIRAHIAELPPRLISVVMPAYETPERFLRAAIASVQGQIYPHWELCVQDDASPSSTVGRVLTEFAAADPRIRWARSDINGHISVATNQALTLASGEWVVLMDHDDLLGEHALYELAAEVAAHPDAQMVYSDEDHIDENGHRSNPYFKPDFDPDLLLGQNVVNHLGAFRRDLLARLGGLRVGFEGSQDHDLALRAVRMVGGNAVRHIPAVLYHWRHTTEMTAMSHTALERCIAASRRAVGEHLAVLDPGAIVLPAPGATNHHRIQRMVPDPAPLVSAIIPTRDRADLLRTCLSGLLERTDYPSLEVLIVDNDSREADTHALFAELAADRRVRVLPVSGPFNYSRLNNAAAAEAQGDILLLLNNDIAVMEPGWLRELVSLAVRPEIGAIGCKLLYEDGTLQHGGVVLGYGGVAGHFMPQARRDDPGPLGLLALTHTVSAVTAACLAIRRELFERAGGLDEDHFAVAFNDVDFCLRVRELGYRNVWTPFAELYHLESATRGDDLTGAKAERFAREVQAMQVRWGEALLADPYWNPNLSLDNSMRVPAATSRRVKPWSGYLRGVRQSATASPSRI